MATSSSLAGATATTASAPSSSNSTLSGAGSSGGGSAPLINSSAAQFREIHKNTWLKRLTAEGKKITVGPKKSDRSWVVFCVHDDTDALLEGYAEPRQAASHNPEWTISMQDTLHISHALIPNSHEFEFVVTLANEVLRFHAMSWEIMQEWVETLRSKLREMKILSPRENLYTKLPEIRAPLLPTRDPTSPLPAPPPVPAAIVPGVERVVPLSLTQDNSTNETRPERTDSTSATTTAAAQSVTAYVISSSNGGVNRTPTTNNATTTFASTGSSISNPSMSKVSTSITQMTAIPALTSMSNTLTQNLLNMLSDPISAYSEQINDVSQMEDASSVADSNDINFDDEFLLPILRNSQQGHETAVPTTNVDNSIRVDICQRISADQIPNWESLVQTENVMSSRLQTSRSLSAGAADSSRKHVIKSSATPNVSATSSNDNITALEISTNPQTQQWQNTSISSTNCDSMEQLELDQMNITIIQVSTNDSNELKQPNETITSAKPSSKRVSGEIFKFPETVQHEYKSNIKIIPSTKANSSTIQVLGTKASATTTTSTTTQYATPVKNNVKNVATSEIATTVNLPADELKITTVHVSGNTPVASTVSQEVGQTVATNAVSLYGTCYNTETPCSTSLATNVCTSGTPKMMKKIILSANTSGITNITVNNASTSTRLEMCAMPTEAAVKQNVGSVHYEKVFLSTSIPPALGTATTNANIVSTTVSSPSVLGVEIPQNTVGKSLNNCSPKPPSPILLTEAQNQIKQTSTPRTVSPSINAASVEMPSLPPKGRHKAMQSPLMTRAHQPSGSPASNRRRFATSTNILTRTTTSSPTPPAHATPPATQNNTVTITATSTPSALPLPNRSHLLTRGLTEAVITTRPSRRDFHLLQSMVGKGKSAGGGGNKNDPTITSNNNGDNLPAVNAGSSSNATSSSRNNRNCELLEQRRRSSSTSEARMSATRGANNNELPGGRNIALRFQQPPQPLRSLENGMINGGAGGGAGSSAGLSSALPPSSSATNSTANKRMTLREHQVMQLRREIMHPGGVRLQLRRKDCVGSIAWVDAFGAVWVAGWKQKEHPVLYNALHIGDQLLSIAGTAIATASEANKIIRNTNTLFVEVLVRRIPFGRGYAIRRDREGQCLGLIRDGNTATIVDIVPNSLAARHGLPPKAQSCDGTTLTFWVLTEINGRPLNLYFKENEIRDRLNSVGRDISILVQPSDLITKLKKQLKSLRGYKDYLVQ